MLTAEGIYDALEKRRVLRYERNGTSSRVTPIGENGQAYLREEYYEEPEINEDDPQKYRVTVIKSLSGEKIALLDMGWDLDEYDITVEMVAYELEQWGEQTRQERSKGYLEEGISFLRNSKPNTGVLHAQTKLKDLGEGYNITLKVIIKWADEHKSQPECAHIEHRHQAAIAAVNESEELKKLAKNNIASPLLSNIGTDGRCKTCGSTPHFQAVCCNCGDPFCGRWYRRNKWDVGDASCFRCFPLVKEVVLNYFDKSNITEWAD